MLNAVNRAALRLWKEESGVVLALTVIVFLSIFMMASAIFTGGETLRQRIELQNAADAAAYSAAIVQADCNSRLAALNRAMSWTYVQMVRMEMDYVVDKWLWLTLKRWKADDDSMRIYNIPSCNRGVPYYVTGKGAVVLNSVSQERILLNRRYPVTCTEIRTARANAAREGKSFTALIDPIDHCRTQIDEMNAKEKELLQKLPGRIEKTVEETLRANTRDTWNDGFAGGAQMQYVLRQETMPEYMNFRVLGLAEEEDFLRHSGYIDEQGSSARDVFEAGTDAWFVKQYAYATPPGIQRGYKRSHPILISEWDWTSSIWVIIEGVCTINPALTISGSSFVKGDDPEIYVPRYYNTAVAKAQILREEYFAKGGSLLVGLTRRLNNPLQFMITGDLGIFRPFTLDGGNRSMWTVSAALAGYNPTPVSDARGRYEVTYEDNTGDKLWNLKTSDWDATLLPLHRAWAKGKKNREWVGSTAGEILSAVQGGPWKPLYGGGGGGLGAQGAPKGMSEGAEVSYGAAEDWVLH